ncbi:MAG: hypothetical protein LAN71_17745 [Acidobacteriia bacterium]|nr:hypothetical protein [Terriglobia bacterium]
MDPQKQDQFDATNIFGVRRPLSTKEEIFHRELERRSFDIIRIKNPDNQDFFAEWDKRYWKVPAQGTLDVPRYVAIKYCKDKAVDTINKLNQKMHDQEMEERNKKGFTAFESKWHEEQATYTQPRYPKTNDKELLTKLYSEYWVGLVYEYGKDQPQQVMNQATEELDMTPIELKIIKEMEGRRVDMGTPAPVQSEMTPGAFSEPTKATQPPLYVSKADLAKEVTIEDAKPTKSKK